MLYLIAEHLGFPSVLNLLRYQSTRTGGAVATALLIGLIIGPRFIGWLRLRQGKGQPIREDGPATHLAKRGTPTMGGLMILTALTISVLMWMKLSNSFTWVCLFVTLSFGSIGFLDDYDKVTKASHKGVSGRVRLLLEFAVAGFASWLLIRQIGTELYLPFFSGVAIDLGWFYILFAAFTIVSFGNAVNLTDGLDGLATMPVIIASVAFLIIVYLVGNVRFADYLGIPYVEGAGELAIFCGAVIGAGLAFLWKARDSPSCGSTRRRRRCSWATPAASRSAAHWAPSRSPPITRSCSPSSAACSCSKRSRSSSRCSGTSAPAGACSAWRQSTTISNRKAGRNRPSSSASGSSRSSSPCSASPR